MKAYLGRSKTLAFMKAGDPVASLFTAICELSSAMTDIEIFLVDTYSADPSKHVEVYSRLVCPSWCITLVHGGSSLWEKLKHGPEEACRGTSSYQHGVCSL